MKKSELIAILQSLPGDPTILIQGYEGGLSDITEPKIKFHPVVLLDYNKGEWWQGPHEAVEIEDIRGTLLFQKEAFEAIPAYVIHR